MQSRRYVAKYGAIRFLSCPGQAETVSKFPAISGAEWKMPSPTPPKSAKVKLREHADRNGASAGLAAQIEHATIIRSPRTSERREAKNFSRETIALERSPPSRRP